MTKEEALDALTELSSTLSAEERDKVLDSMHICQLNKNEVIYQEGDEPQNLFCLLQGKVKIYIDGIGGRCQIVRVYDDFEYFGYRAAFSGDKYATSAAAIEPSCLVCIPLAVIKSLLQVNARLSWFFIKMLATALGKSDERTVNLTQKHICARLADSLLFLKDHYGMEADGKTLRIKLSREDMANLSNMTTNNAIRTLSLFAKEKIIAINGRNISLLEEKELQKISRMG